MAPAWSAREKSGGFSRYGTKVVPFARRVRELGDILSDSRGANRSYQACEGLSIVRPGARGCEAKTAGEYPVAGQNGFLMPELRMESGQAAPQLGFVEDIVMDQRSDMKEFDGCRER